MNLLTWMIFEVPDHPLQAVACGRLKVQPPRLRRWRLICLEDKPGNRILLGRTSPRISHCSAQIVPKMCRHFVHHWLQNWEEILVRREPSFLFFFMSAHALDSETFNPVCRGKLGCQKSRRDVLVGSTVASIQDKILQRYRHSQSNHVYSGAYNIYVYTYIRTKTIMRDVFTYVYTVYIYDHIRMFLCRQHMSHSCAKSQNTSMTFAKLLPTIFWSQFQDSKAWTSVGTARSAT